MSQGGDCPSDDGQAGRAAACQGCPGQATCASRASTSGSGVDDDPGLTARLRGVRFVALVVSGKGGVGKSTVAALLARALAADGLRVGVLDADVCGPNAPLFLGVDAAATVRREEWGWAAPPGRGGVAAVMSLQLLLPRPDAPVAWAGPRRTAVIHQMLRETFWGRCDVLVVDTPPGTTDEHVALANAVRGRARAAAVIVTTPQRAASDVALKHRSLLRKLAVPLLGVVVNMACYECPCCGERTDLFPDESAAVAQFCASREIPLLASLPYAAAALDPAASAAADLPVGLRAVVDAVKNEIH